MSIFVFATIKTKPDTRAAIIGKLKSMADSSRDEPCCEKYEVYESTDNPNVIHILEQYLDQSAVQAHRASKHYQEYRAFVDGKLDAPVSVALMQPLF